jgi:hypothetical protein
MPLRERRRHLEALQPGLEPPIQICPATTDPALAREWPRTYDAADVGIEGLVVEFIVDVADQFPEQRPRI